METKTKVKTRDISLLGLNVVVATLLWWVVDGIALKDSLQSWVILFVCLFLWFLVFVISCIVIEKKMWITLIMVGSFLMSLFFSFSFFQLVLSFIAVGIFFVIHRMITLEKKMIISIEVRRVIRSARALIVILASIMIAGQFYNNVISSGVENLIPEISLGRAERRLIANTVSIFDSSFRASELENMTVDEFVLSKIDIKEEELEQSFFPDNQAIKDSLSGLALEQGREGFSTMVGREVRGDEEIFDVFSEAINNKINSFFKTNIESEYVVFIPWTIFIVLFLMTFSAISFISPVLVFATRMIFAMLVKLKLIEIQKISVEKEVIVQYGG
ncbi:MAG: hypothetical protein OEV93_03495 [Candidatus Moranbacteria bacterium]|nr:hypothetical protein [Candidatus Moranbacteria bacterium]